MSAIRARVDEYLALRRGLGAGMSGAGIDLHHFADFFDREGATHITSKLAVQWAVEQESCQPSTWAARLGSVRRFAAWLSTIDPRTEVPSSKLLPHRVQRRPPYIYSDQEIVALIRAARHLPSHRGMRALSFATLIGLIAATGMRVSEALALDEGDVDLSAGILTIKRTKFGKSRFVPIHPSTRKALVSYVRRRDPIHPCRPTEAFFVGELGRRMTCWAAQYNFAVVSREVGLRQPAGGYRHGHGPRIHDLRHRFASKRLIEWYRAGLNVEREIHRLSTYIGHTHVNDTYWYLQAVPELLQLATRRLEKARPGAKS